MRRILVSIVCSLFVATSVATELDSLLSVYDNEVARSEIYIGYRLRTMDSLRHIAPFSEEAMLSLGEEYSSLQSDSARRCLYSLLDASEPLRSQAIIDLVSLYSKVGLYRDGMIVAEQMSVVPMHLRTYYFDAMFKLYHGASDQTTLPAEKQMLHTIAHQWQDSLLCELRQLTEIEFFRMLYGYQSANISGDYASALLYNDSILSLLDEASHGYAINAYRRAVLYENLGNVEQHRCWLVRAAITDVRCGITDNGASWLVAQECYERGEIERAYNYIDYSLTNASYFNAPQRYIQTHPVGHIISSSREQQQRQLSGMMMVVIVVGAFAMLLLVILLLYYINRKQRLAQRNAEISRINEQLQAANRSLEEANHVKEQYICRYLEVYSDYIRRLTTMARKAGEKDSSAFMDREMDNFYRSFDDTFLSLYGTFVQDFNALLKEEARLTPKPGERMTIEMRIFALILLGINSSAKIAELLCYSPNTISNYRVRIKNNALGDRDTFEDRVRLIGSHTQDR